MSPTSPAVCLAWLSPPDAGQLLAAPLAIHLRQAQREEEPSLKFWAIIRGSWLTRLCQVPNHEPISMAKVVSNSDWLGFYLTLNHDSEGNPAVASIQHGFSSMKKDFVASCGKTWLTTSSPSTKCGAELQLGGGARAQVQFLRPSLPITGHPLQSARAFIRLPLSTSPNLP